MSLRTPICPKHNGCNTPSPLSHIHECSQANIFDTQHPLLPYTWAFEGQSLPYTHQDNLSVTHPLSHTHECWKVRFETQGRYKHTHNTPSPIHISANVHLSRTAQVPSSIHISLWRSIFGKIGVSCFFAGGACLLLYIYVWLWAREVAINLSSVRREEKRQKRTRRQLNMLSNSTSRQPHLFSLSLSLSLSFLSLSFSYVCVCVCVCVCMYASVLIHSDSLYLCRMYSKETLSLCHYASKSFCV